MEQVKNFEKAPCGLQRQPYERKGGRRLRFGAGRLPFRDSDYRPRM